MRWAASPPSRRIRWIRFAAFPGACIHPSGNGSRLESAIRQLWETSGVPQRFEASLQIQALPREPHLEVKVLIYRALQEALNNLVRHSLATSIDATLEVCAGQLVLSVRDDGVGFDAERLFAAPANVAAGIGLRSIREAAEALGGKLDVESGVQGTKLLVSVPPFGVLGAECRNWQQLQ